MQLLSRRASKRPIILCKNIAELKQSFRAVFSPLTYVFTRQLHVTFSFSAIQELTKGKCLTSFVLKISTAAFGYL